MKRWLSFGGAAAIALALAATAMRAQEPQPDGEWEEHAAAAAERAVEAAEAAAERAAEQAERIAERAIAQAEAAADQAAAAAEQAAERAAHQAELAVEHSADARIDVDPFAGGGGGVFFGGKPKEWLLGGPGLKRGAADPEAVKLLELDRKLSRQISELAAKYKGLDEDDERKDAATELAARVTAQFTVRQQMRERELVDLEEQVKRLRDLQDKRAAQMERIVGDRVQQLLREAEGLGWGDGGAEFGAAGGAGDFKLDLKFDAPVIAVPGAPAMIAPKKVNDVKRVIIRSPDGGATISAGVVPPPPADAPEPPRK